MKVDSNMDQRSPDNSAAKLRIYALHGAGAYDICTVCFGGYAPCSRMIRSTRGASDLSLNESRHNYRLYRACRKRFSNRISKPLPEETR